VALSPALGVILRRAKDLFFDDFNGAAIDAAKWSVNDTQGDLSVAGGALVSGPLNAGGTANPGITSKSSFVRKSGRTFEMGWNGEATANWWAGFTDRTPIIGFNSIVLGPGTSSNAPVVVSNNLNWSINGIGSMVSGSSGLRQARVVLLSPRGALLYLRGQGLPAPYNTIRGPWLPVWHDHVLTTSPVWVGYAEAGSVANQIAIDSIRVYDGLIPKPLLVDDFGRGNGLGAGTNVPGNAESGQAWQSIMGATPWLVRDLNTALAGSWTTSGILGLGTVSVANSAADTLVVDAGSAEGIFSAQVISSSGLGSLGIAFRFSDANNGFFTEANGGGTTLYRRQAGVNTSIASSAVTQAGGTTAANVRHTVILCGSSIQVYMNGVRVCSVTDTFNQTATLHGLHSTSSGATGHDFDGIRHWGPLAA
jgi:hypothetical protein